MSSNPNYKLPKNIDNPELYKEAFKIAKETYDRPSAYRSMFIVRKYKELGGEYKNGKKGKKEKKITDLPSKDKPKRTPRWLEEQWVQIKPYVRDGTKVKCGAGDNPKACRPLKSVKGGDDQITMDEIIKKYGKKKVLELTEEKINDMDGVLDWRTGKFTPSGKRKKDKKKD